MKLQKWTATCCKCPRSIGGQFEDYEDFVKTAMSQGWRVMVFSQQWYCPKCAKK